MAKIKGWEKVKEDVWRKKTPSFGKSGTLYEYVYVSRNGVFIADALPRNTTNLKLLENSYIYAKGKSNLDARKKAIKFMRSHTE